MGLCFLATSLLRTQLNQQQTPRLEFSMTSSHRGAP